MAALLRPLLPCLLATAAASAEEKEFSLWPSTAPGERPPFPGPEEDVWRHYPPGNYTGISIQQVGHPTLTPFLVPGSTAAIIVAPGGGYAHLAFSLEGLDTAKRLNSFGVSAFVLKYRVPLRPLREGLPWNWAQLQDAQRAVGLVRGRASSWGLDPERIGFMGFSAGGHLAASLSGAWSRRLYEPVDSYDEVSCRPDRTFLLYPWKLLGKGDQLAPELNVTAENPPAFVASNGDDNVAPPRNGLSFYRKLLEEKVESALHIFPHGGHGFGMCQAFIKPQACCDWPELVQHTLQDAGWTKAAPSDVYV